MHQQTSPEFFQSGSKGLTNYYVLQQCQIFQFSTALLTFCIITSTIYVFFLFIVASLLKPYGSAWQYGIVILIFTSLMNKNLVWLIPPHVPLLPASDNHQSILCFYEFHYFRFLISVISCRLCLSVSTYFTQHSVLHPYCHK